jgi:hypothetical protein
MMTIPRRPRGSWVGPATVCWSIAGIALLLAAPPARAASSIFTGVVRVASGQGYNCRAFNTSPTKTLENVRLIKRKSNGTVDTTTTCPTLGPQAVCGLTGFNIAGASDLMTCEATSDKGARFLRATLSNETTGTSSDAR